MRPRRSVVFAILLVCCSVWAQKQSEQPPSESELAEIAARGRALAGYDAAAWHATDAVIALKPAEGVVQLYVARKTEIGWVVEFGRFDEGKTKFLIAYEAQQVGNSNKYKVAKHDPPLEDGDFYFRAARALSVARAEFFRDVKPQRQYNLSILPGTSSNWYFYAIPAQTDLSVLPYGGDVRYTISKEGTNILDKRQMHKMVLEEHVGNSTSLGFHTHILSDTPEDSDVFYALTRKATQGEWLVTKKYVYRMHPDGTLGYLGTTAETVRLLREGKYEDVPDPYRAMFLSSAQRLMEGTPAPLLEVVTSFSGMRCNNHTVWLKFSHILHNTGDTKIILYKEPLQNAQARFAPTEADVQSGKYEKLVFFTPTTPDFTSNDSFLSLSPGRFYAEDHEYPILGMDMKGKAAVQFLFFTWPLGWEKQIEPQRARLHDAGDLYSETIASTPIPLKIDETLLKSCVAQ